MTAPHAPGLIAPGHAELRVELVSGQTAATSWSASSPLQLLVPRPRGKSVWAYLSSLGGGMVAGDETSLHITAGPGTRCFVGTQASTKIYRNPLLRPCAHRIRASVGDGALLVLAPDSIQAFAGSSFSQAQDISMDPGSNLILVDCFSSGRAARGERWAFSRFQNVIRVQHDSRLILLESLLLDAVDGALDSPCRVGRFNVFALVLLLGPLLRSHAAEMKKRLDAPPLEHRAATVLSANEREEGLLVKIAGESTEIVARHIQQLLHFVPDWLQDDPWARKW